jgi:phosphate/sulfate permease
VTLRIVWAWLLTIPGAAIIAGIAYFLLSLFIH